jgi:hypothetical protein
MHGSSRRRDATGWNDQVLQSLPESAENTPELMIVLGEALAMLRQRNEYLAELIELFYFNRYSVAEIITFLGIEKSTGKALYEKKVDRDLKKARLMLKDIMAILIRENRDSGGG